VNQKPHRSVPNAINPLPVIAGTRDVDHVVLGVVSMLKTWLFDLFLFYFIFGRLSASGVQKHQTPTHVAFFCFYPAPLIID
jgi:hypothetical protein